MPLIRKVRNTNRSKICVLANKEHSPEDLVDDIYNFTSFGNKFSLRNGAYVQNIVHNLKC